ncbi:MAG: GGDEF domain-containing protein [Thermoanaerobaculia bacterium]
MSASQIAVVVSNRSLLGQIRSCCPALEFTEEPRDAAIVIRDAAQPDALSVEIGSHVHGAAAQYVIDRQHLLDNAPVMFAIWLDLARACAHSGELELELGQARELQQLFALERFDAVAQRVTSRVLELAGLPAGTLLVHDHKAERFLAVYSNDPGYRESGDFVPGIPSALLHGALHAPSGYAFSEVTETRMPLLVIPIRHADDMIGVVRIPVPEDIPRSEEAASAAATYVRAIAPAFANLFLLDRTSDLAMRDDLTKAYNRRFFETYLEDEIERARRYGSVLSIIFLDLDDLKLVNNKHGHLIGSRTLQEVAKRILGAVRTIDKVVRFGGDEFCIILPETDEVQARAVASRVRMSLGGSPYRLAVDIEVTITASFGIATYPQHATNKDALIRQADAAMFAVKSTTKDSIGVAGRVPAVVDATE